MTSAQIMAFLFDAEAFLKLLDDQGALQRISELRKQLSAYLDDLSVQKDAIRQKLVKIASHSRARRGEIDLEERLAEETVLNEAEERQSRSVVDIDRLVCEASRPPDSTNSGLPGDSHRGEKDRLHSNELAVSEHTKSKANCGKMNSTPEERKSE